MNSLFRIAASTAAILSATIAFAQTDFEKYIRENPERSAGVHHSYEYIPSAETPAPKGYKPFYLSHYGRHGSRCHIGSTAEKSYDYMIAARDAGILTPLGEELLDAVTRIHEDHVGMAGELTPRGGREHRAIAQRLYDRTTKMWNDKKRTHVFAQSSNVPRCLVSMANFTSSLDDNAPQLRFDFITGEKYINLLAADYYDRPTISADNSAVLDSLEHALVDPSRFMKSIFKGSQESIDAVVPDPYDFVYQIFQYGGIRQCTETENAEILGRFFTIDEILAWYQCYNSRIYNSMGNSIEHGDQTIWAARNLVRDIIDRAEAAFPDESGMAADLRFGHDTGILPLAGLIDLIGPGDRVHNGSASKSWQSFFSIPMGSNLQMIFYRKKGVSDPLVKIYYNEKETLVRGLQPVEGPYYRWSDLKAHLERRIAAASKF